MEELSIDNYCCPKILIVDDDEMNIFALNLLVENEGYKSDHALNG